MTIDEEAFKTAIDKAYPKWGGDEIYQYRDFLEAYEQAKKPDHYGDVTEMVPPATTLVQRLVANLAVHNPHNPALTEAEAWLKQQEIKE